MHQHLANNCWYLVARNQPEVEGIDGCDACCWRRLLSAPPCLFLVVFLACPASPKSAPPWSAYLIIPWPALLLLDQLLLVPAASACHGWLAGSVVVYGVLMWWSCGDLRWLVRKLVHFSCVFFPLAEWSKLPGATLPLGPFLSPPGRVLWSCQQLALLLLSSCW
jgi:hypothetical protein